MPRSSHHPTAPWATTLLPLTIAGTYTTEWLTSPGESLRPSPTPATYSKVANLAIGYTVSWYSTTSLAHGKVRSDAAPWLLPCWDIACPGSLLVWRLEFRLVCGWAIVVSSFLPVGTWCREIKFLLFLGAR